MGANTAIEWTTHTFNPVWGCTKIDPACEHCYAATFANRLGYKWGPKGDRRTFGEKHWNEPLKWNRAAEAAGERHRVFCASMADVFEDHHVWETERPRLFDLIDRTPQLDWLLLTKRPENIRRFWFGGYRQNVWRGATVATVEGTKRIEELIATNDLSPIAFLSMEPLLESVSLYEWLWQTNRHYLGHGNYRDVVDRWPLIHWVIVGGESGHGARPMEAEWATSLRRQCADARVPFFFKQGSQANWPDYKDFNSFPVNLQVRQFPAVEARS